MEVRSEAVDCDIAIVGAGPTGMTAAALLAAEGLRVTVMERRKSTSDEPKAISLDDETLRVYQRARIVDDVLPIVSPGIGTRYFGSDGSALFQAHAAIPYRFGYPYKNPFAQPELERALATSLARNPLIDLRFGCEVDALQQEAGSVKIVADQSDSAFTVSAKYAIAADGGRSTIRSYLGIEMTGRSYDTVWLVVDTLGDPHIERYGLHHGDPKRPHVLVPGSRGRCRYEFLLHSGEGSAGEPPSFELIQKLVAPYRELTPDQVERAVNYTFNGLNATQYRKGRVFLAGDAAHMMPPFAGQGLNSGIRDVNNLTWKLAQVVKGHSPDSILDSYETERRPHADATIRSSEKLGRIVMTTSRRLATHRDRLVSKALTTPKGREFFEEMQYRPSSVIRDGLVYRNSSAQFVGVPIGQPRVFDATGHRYLMLDEAFGAGWALVGIAVSSAHWIAGTKVAQTLAAPTFHIPLDDTLPEDMPVDHVLINLDGGLYREFSPFSGSFVLIRPDRVIAAVWKPEETDELLSHVSPWAAAPAPIESELPVLS